MRTEFLLLAALVVVAGPSSGGRNAHGALIVHTADYIFTADPCGEDYHDPYTCENATTRTDNGEDAPALIWFLAAFPEPVDPVVKTIYFGHDHNLPEGSHAGSGVCGPTGTRDWPDPGWPDRPATSGNVVVFRSPIEVERLFPFYWVMVLGSEGAYYGTDIHPGYGYAAFGDDGIPVVWDRTERFGQVRWHEPGYNECSLLPPLAACCYTTSACLLLPDVLCASTGGEFLPDESHCDPTPCPAYPAACCYGDGHCEFRTGIDCDKDGGFWQGVGTACGTTPCGLGACCYAGWDEKCIQLTEDACKETVEWFGWLEGEVCDPNPCAGWHPAVEQTTWGEIKATYR